MLAETINRLQFHLRLLMLVRLKFEKKTRNNLNLNIIILHNITE